MNRRIMRVSALAKLIVFGLIGFAGGGLPASGKAKTSGTWLEVENIPGCSVRNLNPKPDETVSWSGICTDGKADGKGILTWRFRKDGKWQTQIEEGSYSNGKQEGHWVVRSADGSVAEGSVLNGKQEGHWVVRSADGNVAEGSLLNGKQEGHWVLRFADGSVEEGSYSNEKREGPWVRATAYKIIVPSICYRGSYRSTPPGCASS